MKRREFITGLGAAALTVAARPWAAEAPQLRIEERRAGKLGSGHYRIGALVFDDYETLDLHGPVEMLGHLSDVEIELIGPGAVARSFQGPKVVVDRPLTQLEPLDLFLVPGGLGTRALVQQPELIELIRRQALMSERVLSVCTGAALLAQAGLLDGKRVTTNKAAFAWVASLAPDADWQGRARWVHDGNLTTSSGVSAGTDAALALIAEVRGEAVAQKIAEIAEYPWNRDADNDPFAITWGTHT
ncbi:DJ-1/PfpI family protein [Ferrimonas balearica]|uniref:DJ-1/PfpI family protein n=1 Tax=Ferrimonas balearica TaxID=44012 RepID=UPI001F15FCBA|nr:DJ-1/PfpI family protein [Ferrimonas balearica]MBY6017875.1 DJ-1/PfpI family protein [Halomonas denitrificans]MBY6094229.1 DJ-1/PfpI family protein [Ferrimonas balearica]